MSHNFDQEFRDFFKKFDEKNLSKKDIRKICGPLIKHLRIKMLKKYSLVFFVLVLLWGTLQVAVVNWNIVAIGRLLLIKLLPMWNWTHLHYTKCLLEYPVETLAPKTSKHDLSEKIDCSVCENIDTIYTSWEMDYTHLSEEFLERGLPVLLINSHTVWPEDNFTDHLLTLVPLMASTPCEMSSNLIVHRLANLQELVERVQRAEGKSWFFHIRNCDLNAVKASRLIASRPSFFPPHLEPAYSSWILMSRQYDHPAPKEITLEGIILVRQLQGRGLFRISGRSACLEECGQYTVELKSGEALLFTTDLWELSYFPSDSVKKSVTFITETHFEV